MLRAIFTLITVIVMTLVISLLCIIFSIFGPYSRLINLFAKTWTGSILLAAGVKMEIVGLEKIDKSKSYIFIGNHQSHFDVFAIFTALPLTARFMAKAELYRIPVFGWALAATGTVRIDRSNREKSISSMNDALERIRKGVSVVIFPEGTRSEDGEIKDFKKGGFVLALKGQIPIVPVSISGSRFILRKNSMSVKPGKLKMVFGDPIETGSYSYQDREKLSDRVRQFIISEYDPHYNEGVE
jgi:1-acyl-sn-glycerol-3-phosphate acyltransferase